MQPDKPYDFTDAVFYFFKVLARRPGRTLWVGLWNALLYIVLGGLLLWAFLPFYLTVFELAQTGADPDPSQIMSMFATMAGAGVLAFFGGIAVALMAQGAWLRLLARDEVAPGIPLRLGSDEFRLLGVNILLIIILMGTYFVGALLVAVPVVIGAAGGGEGAPVAIAVLAGVVGVIALIVAMVFLSIRLSPAPALTVLDRKIRLSGAWPVTKGIFWWVFLTYIVLGLIVAFASSMISSFVQLMFLPILIPVLTEISQQSGNMDPDQAMDMLRAAFTSTGTIALFAVAVVISIVGQIFYEGMWHAVGAYLARRHRGLEGTPLEAVPAAPTPPPAPVSPPANTGDAGGDSGSSPA
ncbi:MULTISPECIES: hypothetical protein [Hyphobacterium]|uniref:Glycerophosphoryl diester phosphodiesterase membrane domain-containing protein n=1 Tax=Hyphobacterium vulgare TaxID=1736751 RepID=A0ABV6ZUE1_9PROT